MSGIDRYIDPGFYIKDGEKLPVPVSQFHLAGQHDQSSHGNWSNGGSSGGVKDFSDGFGGFFDGTKSRASDTDPNVKMAGGLALSLMDSVHGIEKDWPDVLVAIDDGNLLGEDEGSLGMYMLPDEDSDRGRAVMRHQDTVGGMAFTLLHELSHHASLGRGTEAFKAEMERPGALKDLMQTLYSSPTGKDLQNIENRAVEAWNKAMAEQDEDKADRMMDQLGFVQYLNMAEEMFARGAAQYIAVKTGNPEVLSAVNESLTDEGTGGIMQWPPDEFGPIMDAFDKYYKERGIAR